MIYEWKPGKRIKADPNLAAQVLNELAEENRLNAESVVEVSEPKEAVLHDDFEWDDTKAADEYRKHQARNIINALIVVEEVVEEAQPIRAYFQIEEDTSNYTPISIIMESEDGIESLKAKARSELAAFRTKYNSIIKAVKAESELHEIERKLSK